MPTPKRKIMVGTPAYDQPVLDYTKSFLASAELFAKANWELRACMIGGLCYVHTARNLIVDSFLHSDCDELIFIDADIGWQPEDLLELCRIERNVIGGVAPYRSNDIGFPVIYKQDGEGHYTGSYLPGTDVCLLAVSILPTAMMRIQRGVFTKLVEKGEALKVLDSGKDRYAPSKIYRFFDFEVEHKVDEKTGEPYIVEYGEDVTFCHKLARVGIEIWCDPRMTLRHHGRTFFEGCLDKSLRREPTEGEILPKDRIDARKSNGAGVPRSSPVPIQAKAL